MTRKSIGAFATLALVLLAAAGGAQDLHAQGYGWGYHEHYFSGGFRLGGMVLLDEDADEVYDDGLGVTGFDFRFHIFQLPLAVQTSFDYAAGDGDPEDLGPGVFDADTDLDLFNWRLSLLVEPPPGAWGDPTRGFWVNPYIGAGFGLHFLDEEVELDTSFGRFREDESDAAFGFHAVGGVDFVFAGHFSAGFEVLYTNAELDGVTDDIDFDGVSFLATLRLAF